MTKEEVLQRANNYCSERSYDSETLTDEFKDKFADFFAKRHESQGIDDEGIEDEIKFNIDTARSAAARGIAAKQKSFESKESDYVKQIEELKKKIPATPPTPPTLELPDEVKNQLKELELFKNEQKRNVKYKEVLELAKKGVRQDLHKSFEKYAEGFEVTLNKTSEEQAQSLTSRFQEIFKDSIGDIKPLAPRQTQKREEEYLDSLPKYTIQ